MYGSVFILRLFNGDLEYNAEDSLAILMNVSICLHKEPRCGFGSMENAIEKAIETSIVYEGEIGKGLVDIVIEDLTHIFKNKFFIFEILFKIYDLCHWNENPEENEENRKIINKIKQKIIFYLSFIKSEITSTCLDEMRNQVLY